MHNISLNRRQFLAVQMLSGLLLVLILLMSASSFNRQSTLPIVGPRLTSNLYVRLNLDGFANTYGLGASTTSALDANHLSSPSAAFSILNQLAGGTLEVNWDVQLGIPRFLTGNSRLASIPYTPTAAERGNPLAIARGFLDENRALFRLQAVAADFESGHLEPDKQLGFSHVRLPQIYKGIPVFARQMIIHLDPQEHIVAVNGQYAPGLNVPTVPSITKEQAEQVALDDLRENQLDTSERSNVRATLARDKTTLTVYVDPKGKATLTWNVQITTYSPLGKWTFFVNARRPVVTHAIDIAENAKFRQTYTARNGTDIPGRLLVEEGERTSDPIAQAAHDGAGKVYDYYFKTFKRDSVDGRGGPMVSTVHFGSSSEDAENAAWIGDAGQMIYGDGGRLFKPLAYGLDVVGHEFTHGVVESTANLIYEGQAGALNESYADIFGALIDRANWTIGEAVVKSPPFPLPYLRSLADPEAQGHYDQSDPLSGIGQPGSMSDYANLPLSRRADNGGVHINSGIPSHAAYFVAQALGKEKTEQIYYRALTNFLSPESDFHDAGLATTRAATELYGPQEANAVRAAFRQVGIDVGGSDNVPAPPTAPTATSRTPTPGPATPPPVETLPAGCRDATVNGDFESDNGWTEVTSHDTKIIDPQLPHTGSQSAWLGGTDKESVQLIYQDVLVPANATSVKLSYYRLLHEEFSGLSGLFASDAAFAVLLADADGNEIQRIETLSSSASDDKWKQVQFDLSRYAGKTVRLAFTAENPPGNISSFFIDDVSLVACTTGQGPAAPPTSSADQVYIEGVIKNAATGRGVAGAEILILKVGVSASSAASDDTVTDDEVLTSGITDNNGYYQTEQPLARNRGYSLIILANGYRPILADDGIKLSRDARNPTQVNATLRRGR